VVSAIGEKCVTLFVLQINKPLLTMGKEGARPGELRFPTGISVTPLGLFVVVDTENHRVQIFKADGTFVKSIGACARACVRATPSLPSQGRGSRDTRKSTGPV
jgi:hypothetical protein